MRKHRHLLPFYLSYAVGLLVPIIFGFLLYVRTTELATQHTESQIDSVVQEVGRAVESIYRDVQFIASQASLNATLVRHASTIYPGVRETLSALLDVSVGDAALAVATNNWFVRDFYLILPANNTVLSSQNRYSLESLFRFEIGNPAVDAEAFLEQIATRDYSFYWSPGYVRPDPELVPDLERPEDLLLIHSFKPLVAAQGVFVFVINRREIDQALRGIDAEAGGVFVLRDAEGSIIHTAYRTAPGFDADQIVGYVERVREIPDRDSLPVRTVRSPNGFVSIDVYLSPQNLRQRTAYVRNVTALTVIVLLALNTALVIFFSASGTRPIRAMYRALGTTEDNTAKPGKSGLRYLQDSVESLVGDRRRLQDEVDRQRPFINSLLMESLIAGIRMNDDELATLLADGRIELGSFNCCFVISISPLAERVARDFYDEFLVKTRVISELLQKRIDGRLYYLLQGSDRIAYIHGFDEQDKGVYYDRFIEQLRSAYEELKASLDEDIYVGVGLPVRRASRLRNSYDQAVASLARVTVDATDAFIEFAALLKDSSNHHYTIGLEIRILNAVRSGDEQALQKALRTVDEENTVNRSVRPMMVSVLIHELKGTVFKMLTSTRDIDPVVQETLIDFIAQEYQPSEWNRFFEAFRKICLDAMAVFREANRNRYAGLRETDVARYLDEHFTDPNLSLVAVATHFDVNDKYLSRFFKEQLRVNYHSYVQNLRLEHATKLLQESDLPLKNVAKASGYSSQATFTRVFRQKYGVNPSTLRPKR
ncbi:MAG: AraC family transcriptional regulator [Spirochaetaceae bacterium]|nr:MAG: AraC family transcriptional regulator [Spirochaetaceae bacterium]